MNLLLAHPVVPAAEPERLELYAYDGAAWFSNRWRCGDKAQFTTVPGVASELRKLRRFAGVGVDVWQLVGELFCAAPQLLDRAMVHLAMNFVLRKSLAPHAAVAAAINVLLPCVGYNTDYQKMLHCALLHRYVRTAACAPMELLVYAIYQQLQLPWYLMYGEVYPTPLHRFPLLSAGFVCMEVVLTHHEGALVLGEIARPSTTRQVYEASVAVWLSVLKCCHVPWIIELYGRISLLHRCILHCYLQNWLRPFHDIVRKTTNHMMSLHLKAHLFCNE